MVKYCCAYGCKESFRKGSGVTFHHFPKDPERRSLWASKLNRKNFSPSDSTFLCSKHFTEDCYDREKFGGTWLKETAVPTIFTFPKHLKKQVEVRECPKKRDLSDEEPVQLQKQVEARECPKKRDLSDEEPEQLETKEVREGDEAHCSTPEHVKVKTKRKRLSYLGDFKEDGQYSSAEENKKWALAEKKIAEQSKKINTLQTKVRRLKNKIASLTALLNEREKISADNQCRQTIQKQLENCPAQLSAYITKLLALWPKHGVK